MDPDCSSSPPIEAFRLPLPNGVATLLPVFALHVLLLVVHLYPGFQFITIRNSSGTSELVLIPFEE
jgi:hypothetical protein